MKKLVYFLLSAGTMIVFALSITSADHIDAPAVTGSSMDITDYYAFQSPTDNNNMVFVANIQGLLSPAATGAATFDEGTLIEFNIDSDGDLKEDMVIQAIAREGKMVVFGPSTPATTGTKSTINTTATRIEVDITEYGTDTKIANENGIKVFAGPRDDPFFFDLGAYQAVLGGTASGFSNPGTDTFAGTNVLSLVVEIPKSMLGNATTLNTWVATKIK